jgi:hypothetical protein
MAGPTQPTYRENVTDKEQDVIEQAEFEGGIGVMQDQKTRVVMKERQGGTERTANAGSDLRDNAGVVMPHDDTPNRFTEDVGKP